MILPIETLGKYRILEELGRGGFATVYRAEDSTLGREVALKVLHPQLLTEAGWVERFHREARAIARLRHPHIITIYEIGEAEGRLFITMELFKAGSIQDRLAQQGCYPWAEAMTVLQGIAAALDYAHGEGIIHRDLKPANILLDPHTGAVLTDFGFAKLVGESSMSLSLSGGVMGTPAYIAPEIWDGQDPTAQSDIYALGCVVYELLTGERLFEGKTPSVVMRKHLIDGPQFPVDWPEGTPQGVEDVLRKALAREPGGRYASAGELLAASICLVRQQHGRDEAEAECQDEITVTHTLNEMTCREEERQRNNGEEQTRCEIVCTSDIQSEIATHNTQTENVHKTEEEHQEYTSGEQIYHGAARETRNKERRPVPVWGIGVGGLLVLALVIWSIWSAMKPDSQHITDAGPNTSHDVIEATSTPRLTATPKPLTPGITLPQAEIVSIPQLYTRIRVHLSTTSDWTTITTLDDACLQHAEVISKEGDIAEEWTSLCGFGITQSLDNAERGENCAKTVEYDLSILSTEKEIRFRVERGDIGSTQVEIFTEDGRLVHREIWDTITKGNPYAFAITADDFGEWVAPPSVTTSLHEVEILWNDDFSSHALKSWKWANNQVKIQDGLAHLTGHGEWVNTLTRVDYSLRDRTGVLVSFKADDGAVFGLLLSNGDWDTSNYRRWSLAIDENRAYSESWQGTVGNNEVLLPNWQPGIWYDLWLGVEEDGTFVTLVWERDNPVMAIGRREIKGDDWANRDWRFAIQVLKGIVALDDYYELSTQGK